ncbi:MAG: F0F1 ATP synthase subunit gamma [Rhodothalassiaceae bacterium]
MPSLKDLRGRISSVKSTRKITSAMKMVAASKLRRAQEAAVNARPYAERMEAVLTSLAQAVIGQQGTPPLLVGTGQEQTHLIVVATSERGLCGALNANIAKAARRRTEELLGQGKQVKILCVGRKGFQVLKRSHGSLIIDTMSFEGVRNIGFEQARSVGERVLKLFADNEFDVATIYYAHFQSALTQEPRAQQLIPLPLPEEGEGPQLESQSGAIYEYEPNEAQILADLLPRNVSVQIFKALLENAASEQGARMTAMDSATRNASDMIDQLTLDYNRSRQSAITKELIEIISGAEAL